MSSEEGWTKEFETENALVSTVRAKGKRKTQTRDALIHIFSDTRVAMANENESQDDLMKPYLNEMNVNVSQCTVLRDSQVSLDVVHKSLVKRKHMCMVQASNGRNKLHVLQ